MSKLQIENVVKTFGAVRAVDGVSLVVEEGETVVLLGSSGCGKTTLLRMIAGFLRPNGGEIRVRGRTVASDTVMVPPERRSLSMVFQSYAVWPHKTVFENLAYGLKLRRLDSATIRKKVEEALDTVRMSPYAARYPAELSGGQQQRVALARALVLEPEILLFDEPLSNLDATLREHMRFEIKALLTKLRITSIYVTHDQNEAMVVADRIAVMNSGRIEQLGTAEEVYFRSRTDFVAQFIGLANVLEGEFVAAQADGTARVRINGTDEVVAHGTPPAGGRNVRLFLRPESVALTARPDPGMNVLRGRITRRTFLGSTVDYIVDVNGMQLRAVIPSDTASLQLGDDTLVSFAPARCLVFEAA